jgi:hypothetical protein
VKVFRWVLGLWVISATVACEETPGGGPDGDVLAGDGGRRRGRDAAVGEDAGGTSPADAGARPAPAPLVPLPWEDCEGGGRTLEAGPEDYRDVLGGLSPGDVLQLRPGSYERGIPVRVSGEPGRCIVIEGKPGEERPVILGSNSFNLISFRGSSWVKVRHLAVDGLGMAGFGVASQGGHDSADHHIVIEDIVMEGLGGDQQIVGISTKSTAWDWVIRGNRIVGAGTGMYLGNSDGTSPFIRGLIELNAFIDTIGYNAQIKHQTGRPDLADMPTEPAETVIRHNVFTKANNASSGGNARPNLLLGHLPPSGNGSNDRYLVYGNFFYENPVENLVQAEGNVAFYNNVLVNHEGWGGATFRPHNDTVKDIDVFFNTVLTGGRPINVSGGADGFEQHVRYNAVFSAEGLRVATGQSAGNIEASLSEASSQLVAPDREAGAGLDLHPVAGALQQGADRGYLEAFPHALVDFDGRTREGTRAGAYAGPASLESVPLSLERRDYR